jgi:hypothetical protein
MAPVMIRALAETELTTMEAAEASKARREIEVAVICFLSWAAEARTLQCELPVLLSTPLVPEVPELPVVLGCAVPVLAAAPTALSPCGFDALPVAGAEGEDAAGDPAFCRPASCCEGAPAWAQAAGAKAIAQSRIKHFIGTPPRWPLKRGSVAYVPPSSGNAVAVRDANRPIADICKRANRKPTRFLAFLSVRF